MTKRTEHLPARSTGSERIYEQLADDIVSGKISPGTDFPGERRLAEVFEVSRQTVREAVQRLVQTGLLTTTRAAANTVSDFAQRGGLCLLPVLLRNASVDTRHVTDTFDLRALLRAEAARSCASYADDATRVALAERRAELASADSEERMRARDGELWQLVFQGAQSLPLRWARNDVERALQASDAEAARRFAVEMMVSEQRCHVVQAILQRDSEAAEARARADERATSAALVNAELR